MPEIVFHNTNNFGRNGRIGVIRIGEVANPPYGLHARSKLVVFGIGRIPYRGRLVVGVTSQCAEKLSDYPVAYQELCFGYGEPVRLLVA